MLRLLVVSFVVFTTMQGCALDRGQIVHTGSDKEYISASRGCVKLSLVKEIIKVPSGQRVTTVEIPLRNDPRIFNECMTIAGFPTPKVDPERYLTVARRCFLESNTASKPDEAYADCVRRSDISVDVEVIHKPE